MPSFQTTPTHDEGAARVWGSPRTPPTKPPTTPRPASRTTSLPFQQARELLNAWAFAEAVLPPDTKWAHAAIVLEQSSDFRDGDPRAYLAHQGRILTRIRDFLLRRGLPAHCLWVREISPRYGRAHTHLLLPLPPELRSELTKLIYRVGRLHDVANNSAVIIKTNGNRGINTPASRRGVLFDFLKSMSPKATLNGTPIMRALGILHTPCTILGKRSGTSESLSRKARAAAGWRELEALPDLTFMLERVEEMRRQRKRVKDRERRRRYRERKASGEAVPWSPPTRSGPAEACCDLGADLGDDFLELEE